MNFHSRAPILTNIHEIIRILRLGRNIIKHLFKFTRESTTKRVHIQITKRTINKNITHRVRDHSSAYISLDSIWYHPCDSPSCLGFMFWKLPGRLPWSLPKYSKKSFEVLLIRGRHSEGFLEFGWSLQKPELHQLQHTQKGKSFNQQVGYKMKKI